MHFTKLNENLNVASSTGSNLYFTQIEYILNDLKERDLPDYVVNSINAAVEELNATTKTEYALQKLLKQKQSDIVKLLEKELKIVPINYYRNLWMVVGMAAFGLPLGVAFGTAIGNMGMMAIGLPIGMALGIAMGSNMDKKAQEEGRQLSVEIKQ